MSHVYVLTYPNKIEASTSSRKLQNRAMKFVQVLLDSNPHLEHDRVRTDTKIVFTVQFKSDAPWMPRNVVCKFVIDRIELR